MRRTILIIHPGSLGDLLLALPAIQTMRRAFPDCDTGLLAQGEASRLLRACGEVRALFPIETDALAALLSDDVGSVPGLQSWLQTCDLAVAWMEDRDGRLRAALEHAGVQQVMVRSPISGACRAVHQEDRFLETVEKIGRGIPETQRLVLPPALIASAKARLDPIVNGRPSALIHPGSGSLQKCGDPALFVEAIAYCETRGMAPVLIGGPADDEAVSRVGAFYKRPLPILHRQPLQEIAGALTHARLFIGNDSGLSHLAARLHLPMIALFGPTDPQRWAPRGPHVTVLRGETCRCESWEAVRACTEQPCLRLSTQRLIAACEATVQRDDPVRDPSDRLVMSENLC